MKKILKCTFRDLIILICILIFSVFVLMAAIGDALDGSAKITQNDLTNNAEMYSQQLDRLITDRMDYARQLAINFAKVGLNNTVDKNTINQIMTTQKDVYDSISVLNMNGGTIYGDALIIDLTKEEIYDKVVYQQETQLYDQLIYLPLGDPAILICTPICKNKETIGVLLCCIKSRKINAIMDQWGYSKNGCCTAISENGRYMTGGKQFSHFLKGEANNFYTYMHNASILSSSGNNASVEEAIVKNQTVSLKYRYNGQKYFGVICASTRGDFYYVFMSATTSVNADHFKLSQGTVLLLCVTGVIWIVWMSHMVICAGKQRREHEVLELFALVNKCEKALLFDFQQAPKRLRFIGDSMAMFGMELKPFYGEAVYDIYNYVHKDDKSIRGRLHRFIDGTENDFNAEIRIRDVNDQYAWYRITGTLVQDNRYGLNQRFVGKIECADQQITEERNLMQRAENDLLTGVLNKKTMEEKVTECLKDIKGGYHYIFFMVDLDNFKNVNDNLGHISGDQAIKDTADCLVKIFPKDAFVGRLGGDEFAVCAAYDAFDKESLISFIEKKANKICEANRRVYQNNDKEVHISSSVGIAVAPDFTDNFEMLYGMADRALYCSKNGGKNRYTIYRKL